MADNSKVCYWIITVKVVENDFTILSNLLSLSGR